MQVFEDFILVPVGGGGPDPVNITLTGRKRAADDSTASSLVAVVCAVDLVSRLVFAWLGDVAWVKRVWRRPRKVIFAVTGVGTGVAMAGGRFGFQISI